MEDEIVSLLALTRITGIGPVHTKKLLTSFGSATAVFGADRWALQQSGLQDDLVEAILQYAGFSDLQAELKYLYRNNIRILRFDDPEYPRRLSALPYPPVILFFHGNTTLNARKVIAIAGTRTPSSHGIRMTEQFVRELKQPDLLVLSGLAFGIDAAAHRAAMAAGIPTVGVLGSGLNQIYPKEHWGLARSMVSHGGILSAASFNAKASLHSFPVRNQLIAAISDVLVVMETGLKGGSLSAAASAGAMSKPVFAAPGRMSDEKSYGCLELIRENKATVLLSAAQVSAAMGWQLPGNRPTHQPSLPFDTVQQPESADPPAGSTSEEQHLLTLLGGKDSIAFDDLVALSRQGAPSLSCTLLGLELRGQVHSLPGNRYCLAGR